MDPSLGLLCLRQNVYTQLDWIFVSKCVFYGVGKLIFDYKGRVTRSRNQFLFSSYLTRLYFPPVNAAGV